MPERRDALWHSTCFELFMSLPGGGYVEYNFSPSKAWASYRFESYRQGKQSALELPHPLIFLDKTDDNQFGLVAFVELGRHSQSEGAKIALSAVIEETNGTKSYWALRHPPGPPDFHHPDCFALTLPAPEAA